MEISIKFMTKNIDEKNVVDTLAFLLSYELPANIAKKLERKCVKFLSEHRHLSPRPDQARDWCTVVQKDPHLL